MTGVAGVQVITEFTRSSGLSSKVARDVCTPDASNPPSRSLIDSFSSFFNTLIIRRMLASFCKIDPEMKGFPVEVYLRSDRRHDL